MPVGAASIIIYFSPVERACARKWIDDARVEASFSEKSGLDLRLAQATELIAHTPSGPFLPSIIFVSVPRLDFDHVPVRAQAGWLDFNKNSSFPNFFAPHLFYAFDVILMKSRSRIRNGEEKFISAFRAEPNENVVCVGCSATREFFHQILHFTLFPQEIGCGERS